MWDRSRPRGRVALVLFVALGLCGSTVAADGLSKEEEARRKKLVRLAAGKPKLPAPTAKVYSLEALLDRTLDQNPLLVARKHAELYAELRQDEANWAVSPSIKIESQFTVVPADTDINRAQGNLEKYLELDVGPFSANSVRIIIPIFTFGKIAAAKDLAALGIDQARLDTKKQRLKLIAQTKEAYYSLQLGKHIQAITADGRSVIKEEIERQNEAREFGDEDVDVPQLRKLQIFDAEFDVKAIDNERLVGLTRSALGALTGMENDEFDVPPFDESDDTGALLPLSVYLDLAKDNRPDFELLNALVSARKRQVDLERAKFYPDIYFAGEFRYGFSTEEAKEQQVKFDEDNTNLPDAFRGLDEGVVTVAPFSDPYNYTRFGFLLGARIDYNPAQRYWKYQQAQAKLAEARSQRTAALEGIDIQIEKRWRETDDERRKIEAWQRNLKAADRWRKQVAIAFESGGAELKDFLEPLKAWYNARLKLLEAQYNFRVNLAKLGELVGLTDIAAVAESMPMPARVE